MSKLVSKEANVLIEHYLSEIESEFYFYALDDEYDIEDSVTRLQNYIHDNQSDWSESSIIAFGVQSAYADMSEKLFSEAVFHLISNNEKKNYNARFIESTYYAYLEYDFVKQMNECCKNNESKFIVGNKNKSFRLDFSSICQYLSQLVISKWWQEANEVGGDILNSINYCNDETFEVTTEGRKYNPISWFVVDLFVLFSEGWYVEKNAKHPGKKSYQVYQKVLDNWDSKDLVEVDQLVYLLCESHLLEIENKNIIDRNMDSILDNSGEGAIAEIVSLAQGNTDTDDFMPRDISHLSVYLFPYEILTWLSLREKRGLRNPETFSHPLMNQPLVSSISLESNEKPFLPYAQKILERGRLDICRDVTFPA